MLVLANILLLLVISVASFPTGVNKITQKLQVQLLDSSRSQLDYELAGSQRALLKLKDRLGPSEIASLLELDIEHANAAWHDIVAKSDPASHVLVEAHLKAILPTCNCGVNFTVASFLDWFARGEPDNENKMLAANPEHYVEIGGLTADGSQKVDILEAWGSLITHYILPRYAEAGTLNTTKQPWLKALPDYRHQFVADATLLDGSGLVIGYVHNSFKDISGRGVCGVEAILSVWVPSATPAEVVEGLRQHQAVEFTNWLTTAYEDIKTRVFTP